MRKYILLFLLITTGLRLWGFESNNDNVMCNYYVELYKTEAYAPDFEKVFGKPSKRYPVKKLQEYLNTKKEIEQVLRMAVDEYYQGFSSNKMFAEDYLQGLREEVVTRNADDIILLRINSTVPKFQYNGEYKVSYIESVIIPDIEEKYAQQAVRDSINQVYCACIQQNLEGVQHDIVSAEQALDESISPRYGLWIVLSFSLLVIVFFCVFFFIRNKKRKIV